METYHDFAIRTEEEKKASYERLLGWIKRLAYNTPESYPVKAIISRAKHEYEQLTKD